MLPEKKQGKGLIFPLNYALLAIIFFILRNFYQQLIIISFLVFLDEGVDGLNELAANLSMNESDASGAVGAVGPGGNGKPGCENGAGCASRTGLEDSIRSMSMNETKAAIGADGTRVAEWAIGVGGTGKPGGAGGSGGIGNPECVSRTGVDGLEDFIDNLSIHETEQAIGAGGVGVAKWAKEVIGADGTEGAFVAPYSGPLFPAYSSKVSIKRTG